MEWAGNVERTEDMRSAYEILIGKAGRKRPLGRSRRRWEDNIRLEGMRRAYEILIGKPGRKRPLGRPRR